MSEGRRPEGIGPGTGRRGTRAPGSGPHPLLAAFAELGWRPSNGVVLWLGTLPRDTTADAAIQRIPPTWEEALGGLGAARRCARRGRCRGRSCGSCRRTRRTTRTREAAERDYDRLSVSH